MRIPMLRRAQVKARVIVPRFALQYSLTVAEYISIGCAECSPNIGLSSGKAGEQSVGRFESAVQKDVESETLHPKNPRFLPAMCD